MPLTKRIHNLETGEVLDIELTAQEIAELEQQAQAIEQAEAEAQAQKQAILDRLGLTEDELRIVLG